MCASPSALKLSSDTTNMSAPSLRMNMWVFCYSCLQRVVNDVLSASFMLLSVRPTSPISGLVIHFYHVIYFSWLTLQKFYDRTEKLQEFETPLNRLFLVTDCGSVHFLEIYFVLNSSDTALPAVTAHLINHTHTRNCEFLL